jgi:hypothetical protein
MSATRLGRRHARLGESQTETAFGFAPRPATRTGLTADSSEAACLAYSVKRDAIKPFYRLDAANAPEEDCQVGPKGTEQKCFMARVATNTS